MTLCGLDLGGEPVTDGRLHWLDGGWLVFASCFAGTGVAVGGHLDLPATSKNKIIMTAIAVFTIIILIIIRSKRLGVEPCS